MYHSIICFDQNILSSIHFRTYVFEVHVERDKLLGNLDLPTAVAAILHLVFIIDLKYPEECKTVWDILQRKVARFGDKTGRFLVNSLT